MNEILKNNLSKARLELRKVRVLVGMAKGSFHEILLRLRSMGWPGSLGDGHISDRQMLTAP